jgi:retinol-binding protein 3
MKRIVMLLCIAVLSVCLYVSAQNKPESLSELQKKQTVEFINKLLNDEYIFPDVAQKMINTISANFKKGNYNSLTNPAEFAERLTHDLISVSNDKHFIIELDPRWIEESKKAVTAKDSLELLRRDFAEFKKRNFAFEEVKILDGNIGYLNLIGFCPTSFAGETAVAAMNFLSNTDAIIIDLRNNGGGSSEMVQLLSSYFLNETPQVLVEFYTRKGNETQQDYNLQYLPGKRMPDKDLYILTSHGTFSAAESFTYIMKNRKRATIIGETTGGGAHPVSREIINDLFTIRIPISKPIDPLTKNDWEGTGIAPDVEVPAKDALMTAQIKAIEKLATTTNDNKDYLWQLDGLKGRQHPVNVDAEILKSYAGKYGQRKIIFENGDLYFQKEGQEKHKLVAIANDLFLVDDMDYVRIKIILENGKPAAINRLFDNGDSRIDKKND